MIKTATISAHVFLPDNNLSAAEFWLTSWQYWLFRLKCCLSENFIL